MMRLRDAVDRLFEETFSESLPTSGRKSFPVDVYDENNTIVVEADLPGVKPEEVALQVQGDHFIINAQSERQEKTEEQNCYRLERISRRYSRVIPLPTPVRADLAEANFENGTLQIRLPRSAEARPRRISIKGGETLEGETRQCGEGQQAQQP